MTNQLSVNHSLLFLTLLGGILKLGALFVQVETFLRNLVVVCLDIIMGWLQALEIS